MNILKSTLIITVLSIPIFSGCCSKVGCLGSWDVLTFKWEHPQGSFNNTFGVYDESFTTKIYSYSNTGVTKGEFQIRALPFTNTGRLIFVFQSDSIRDTINPVMYSAANAKVKCNRCYPFGYDRMEVRGLKSFEYWYKGTKYGIDDVLKL